MSVEASELPQITSDPHQDSGHSEDLSEHQEYRWVKGIIADYLRPDGILSLDDAVSQVAPRWNHKSSLYINPVISAPIYLAEQIPYDDPSHRKLAKFMLAVHDSAKWISKDKLDQGERKREQRSFWVRFCRALFDNDWCPEENIETDEGYVYMAYANFCAFVANLEYPKTSTAKFQHTLVKAALDYTTELDSSFATEVREARIIGAAQYIFSHSQDIFEEVIQDQEWETNIPRNTGCFARLKKRRIPPPTTISGIRFMLDDWKGWKAMFRTAAADETLGQKCQDIAQRAEILMSLQEEIANDRSPGT